MSAILESISDGLIALDREWRFVFVNRRAAETMGMEPGDLLGKSIWETAPVLRGTIVEENYRRAMDRKEPVRFEMRGLFTDRWFEVTAWPSDEGLSVIGRDITDRKIAEATFTTQSRVSRALAEASSMADAGSAILTALREALEADVGELWLLDRAGGELRLAGTSAADRCDGLDRFLEASLQQSFRLGQGLPGIACQRRGSVYATELTAHHGFLRTQAASEAGLRCGMTYPLQAGDEVVGAIQFLSRNPIDVERTGETIVASAAAEIAQCVARWRAEDVAREKDDVLHSIIEGIEEPLFLKKSDGRYRLVNSAGARLLGKTIDQVLGRTDEELFDSETAKKFRRNDLRVLTTGRALDEEELVEAKGRTFLTTKTPYRETSGEVSGIIGIARDITELKRRTEEIEALNEKLEQVVGDRTSELARRASELESSEEALREKTRILQSILDSMGDGVVVADENGQVLVWNPAARAILGDPPPTVATDSWRPGGYRAFLPDGITVYSPSALPIRRAMEGEPTDDAEVIIRQPTGEEKWLSVTARPLRDGEGRLRGGVSVLHDVTDRKLAEREVKDTQRQLRSLAAQLTFSEQRERRRLSRLLHDHLQQVLAAAKLALASLEGELADEPARASLRQVDELIEQSIEASRTLSVELSPPVLYETGLAPALHWLANHMRKKYGLEVAVEADPDAEPAADDIRALLFEAVRELLFNVIKHGGIKQASVRMSSIEKDQLEIVVSDHGVGFDPDTLQAEDRATEAFGLFSIRERLQLSGGSMQVASRRGGGTRIALRAPRRALRPAEAVDSGTVPLSTFREAIAPPAELAPGRGYGRTRVVLADDHKILREGLAGLLRQRVDIEIVGEAADGEEAVDLAVRLRPDVIVMDISMPRMNGIEATERITRELDGVRVIGLSMHAEEHIAQAMRGAGASAVLTKGGPVRDLITAIRGES